ncbi:uncharacterized protein G2W53_003477 [Senna tora]|uniref:Uncharacterized protein n=1 Tax=Senna tora TaxID=362788 RepID=A0A834XA78_9FABA|nr:uncharacterized protein G2W53_003477 [Senna tora]
MSQVHEQGASHHPFARDVGMGLTDLMQVLGTQLPPYAQGSFQYMQQHAAGGMEHDQFNTPLANPYVPSPPEPSRGPHFCEGGPSNAFQGLCTPRELFGDASQCQSPSFGTLYSDLCPHVAHTGLTFDLNQPPSEEPDQQPECQQFGDSQPCHNQSEDEDSAMAVRGSWVPHDLPPASVQHVVDWSEGHREHAPVLPTRAPNLPALHAGVEEEGTSRPTFPGCEPSTSCVSQCSPSMLPSVKHT